MTATRILLSSVLAALVVAAGAAVPAAGAVDVLNLPRSTAGTKPCSQVTRNGYVFRVRIITGPLRCKTARRIVRRYPDAPHLQPKGWAYYDMTKLDRPHPWSDVYVRHRDDATIGAIIRL